MNEDGFRAYLAHRLSYRSVSSYISNARRAEVVLKVDLAEAVRHGSLQRLEEKLRRARTEFTAGSLADCLTALRTYFKYAEHNGQPSETLQCVERDTELALPKHKQSTPVVADEWSKSLAKASVRDLLSLHGGILSELRLRGVVRTGNSPLGDYVEHLFVNAFGWRLTKNSAAGYDATQEGTRYQIKGRRIGPTSPSRQLGAIRNLPEKPFDVLAAALFDESYTIIRGILMPYHLVIERARHVAHTNSWRLMLEDRCWTLPDVVDVTMELKEAQGL